MLCILSLLSLIVSYLAFTLYVPHVSSHLPSDALSYLSHNHATEADGWNHWVERTHSSHFTLNQNSTFLLLSNVSVLLDGTGARPLRHQTVEIEGGRIVSISSTSHFNRVRRPSLLKRLRATNDTLFELHCDGLSVIPGLVGMHEHLFYPIDAANSISGVSPLSAPLMYLGNGVTTLRTTGSLEPQTDVNVKFAIDAGKAVGPSIVLTSPYLDGQHGYYVQNFGINTKSHVKSFVDYYADVLNMTWFKAYKLLEADLLEYAVQYIHSKGPQYGITGHLCEVPFSQAIRFGMDGLEHGLYANTDFVVNKKPFTCTPYADIALSYGQPSIRYDVHSEPIQSLIAAIIAANVSITSTLPVFEISATFNRSFLSPLPNGDPSFVQKCLSALTATGQLDWFELRSEMLENTNETSQNALNAMFEFEKRFEFEFVSQGGHLIAGVDPTGIGGNCAGFGDLREMELLFEAGFKIEEIVKIYSLNGAQSLGRDKDIGSIEVGKRADFAIFSGDFVSNTLEALHSIRYVIKEGQMYDAEKLQKEAMGYHY